MYIDNKIKIVSDFLKIYDLNLYNHCMRTARYSIKIGYGFNCNVARLYNAAMVHDIGKVAILRDLFEKPGGLDLYERTAINLHSFIGYSILKNLNVDEEYCLLILYHHGFDKETFGVHPSISDKLILESKILRAVDAYDALTSARAYCDAKSHSTTMKILYDEGTFDINILNYIDLSLKNEVMN